MVWLTTTLAAAIAGIVLAVIAIFFALDLSSRTEKMLKHTQIFMVFALICFVISELLLIIKELFFINIGPLYEILTLVFIGLLLVSLWSCRYAIRQVDGSLRRR